MKHLKKVLLASFVAGLFASWLLLPSAMAFTLSPPLKVWSNGEVLKASDLNSNFSTIANAAVRLLVNSDISGSAAIAHSKLATPALVPKAWATVTNGAGGSYPLDGACTAPGACTLRASSRVTSVVRAGSTGVYNVTLAYTPANSTFFAMTTTQLIGTNPPLNCLVAGVSATAPHLAIDCYNTSSGVGAAADAPFAFVVYDNDN